MNGATNRAGWLAVLGSTIALMVSNGPVLLFTFGIFLKPISEQYGWARGTMSLGVSIGRFPRLHPGSRPVVAE